MLIRIIAAAALTIVIEAAGIRGAGRLLLYLAAYFVVGYDIVWKACRSLKNGRGLDENFLMTVATLGAFSLAIYEHSGDYLEAIAVMLFYQTGELFQSYAVGKSRKSISELMDIRPDYANLERDGQLTRVDPDEVAVGTVIVVQPGEKIPIDGVIVDGASTLDTAALTGESLPRDVEKGMEVISGCINMTGVLRVKTTKEFGESTVSKVLELVEDSSSHKARSEYFIARFARIYTPIVCGCAIALALLPPLTGWLFDWTHTEWNVWLYRALIFLVISCPCALVISIPLSFFAGIGGASREGILVKGANLFETLSKVKTVVLDKTGTLTLGVFEVSAVHNPDDHDAANQRQRLIELAALVECASSHPIGKSLQKAYAKPIDRSRVSDIHELPGHGIVAKIDGIEVAVGNEKLMNQVHANFSRCHCAGTIVHIAIEGKYAGHIVLGDVEKPHAREAISALHTSGVKRTVMLTGDGMAVAKQVAGDLGIDEVHSDLLPADKVKKVEELLKNEPAGEALAFVGDGINDAPVLARADVGIAMGALGSDAAIEAADVVLMDDNPLKIAKAIRISRKCLRIVWQNIVFAIGVKVVCLVLGAVGIANMWFAIFADVGVMILAVLNAMRTLHVKNA